MHKTIFILGFLSSVISVSHSQPDPQFSQSMFNITTFNPGSVGNKNAICATALNRQQWVGFEGGPIQNDEIEFQSNLSLNASYAYRMDAGNSPILILRDMIG